MKRASGLVLTLLLALGAGGLARAQDAAPPPGSAENGFKIVMAKGCWECHGTGGQCTGAGPQLAPGSLPFESFLNQLRHPGLEMPPYEEKIISQSEAQDIYAYLRTQKVVDAKTIPLLH